jgi:hypothetical protein
MTIKNPVVNKVFNDLEDFKEYCTTELDRFGNPIPFNEANMYNDKSWTWNAYKKWRNWQRNKQRFKGRR